jgi:DNA-binding response OmpR family regulator
VGNFVLPTLTDHGDVVYEAPTGQEAIQFFTATPTDMLIVDIGLPDSNGVDVIRELRALSPELLFLVISGNFADVDLRNAFHVGIRGFLPKPFSIAELSSRVKQLFAEPLSLNAV